MKYIILVILMLLLSVTLYAEDTNKFITAEKIEQGKNLGADNVSKQVISDDIRKQAEEMYIMIQNKVMPNVEAYKSTIILDNKTGTMTFTDYPQENTSMAKEKKNIGPLLKSERIYVFISSSMPLKLLEKYSEDIDAFGLSNNAVFVLRGCVPSGGLAGCGDFKQTMNFVSAFVLDAEKKGRGGSLWIDPILFKKYQITEVPAFVYAKNVLPSGDIGSEGDFSRLEQEPLWWTSTGDWSLDYHLNELYEKSKSANLKKITGDNK